MVIGELFHCYHDALLPVYGENEALSGATLLLEELHGVSRSEYLFQKEKDVSEGELSVVIEKIIAEVPLQYIIGYGYFYDRKFSVREGVLIPRNETEELVQWIIKDQKHGGVKILDIGTGSGAIAVTLSLELENCSVSAIDLSEKALVIAAENNKMLGSNVSFRKQDILSVDSLGSYDVIVSNPPYVTESEKSLMYRNVLDYEPSMALFVSDADPLLFYRRIAKLAYEALSSEGTLYFEINEHFGVACCDMLRSIGFQKITLRQDLNSRDRMVKAQK